jgi:hypothetical protein
MAAIDWVRKISPEKRTGYSRESELSFTGRILAGKQAAGHLEENTNAPNK